MDKAKGWQLGRRLRQVSQALFFLLFLYLLVAALQRRVAFPLADLFFRFDPLSALGAMLASREWLPRLGLALITVGITLLLGRVWCGWICPLGTVLEWLGPGAARGRAPNVAPQWRSAKYLLLVGILAAAVFGSLTLLVLDPLALFTRTMTTVILPALNYGVTAIFASLYSIAPLRGVLDALEHGLRGTVLPVQQPLFAGNWLIAGVFGLVLLLNRLAKRFWCRYLCPLGALLAWLARIAVLRPVIGVGCVQCGRCRSVCPVEAIQVQDDFRIVASECVTCLDCFAACPERGIGWRPVAFRTAIAGKERAWPAPAEVYDPGRRQVLVALAAGIAGVVVLRTNPLARSPDPTLIRPPGAQDEATFLARCLRCSQCMKVCPTSGLQPALLQGGPEAFWTPHLVPRLGYCNYGCNACGQVCPSGAIPLLDLERKRQAVLGCAVIDRDRCLPWAHGVACIVCEEMCPVAPKAIRLDEVTITDDRGVIVTVQRPYVVSDLCIGCGICEYQCPVAGEAAIRVFRTA
ncbi:MAG: 4Fe-4S binding protein [Anaerolineae bacterium]|nr:4Fe-4S binding protein [Anaerolineae bacterium]MDW8070545.1 4Fe-4S binding protein [Anaerolineae bacterium]